MISETLTLVFAVCTADGSVDHDYESALGVSRPTYDCALVLGAPKHDQAFFSSHLTVLVPKLEVNALEDPDAALGLARALTRVKRDAGTKVGATKTKTKKAQAKAGSQCSLNLTLTKKKRTETRLGPTERVHVKWAAGAQACKTLYQEAALYLCESESKDKPAPRFFGYYEALGLGEDEVFAVAIFEHCLEEGGN